VHIDTRLAVQPPGALYSLIPSADNRSCGFVLQTQDDLLQVPRLRIVFDNKLCVEGDALGLTRWALSYDGTKLATACRVVTGQKPYYDIRINGESAYRSELDTIHHFAWLSNDELAWEGWMDQETAKPRFSDRSPIIYVVNGDDVTGQLEFDTVLSPRGSHIVRVCQGGKMHSVFEDGRMSEPRDCERLCLFHGSREPHERREKAEEIWSKDRRQVRVSFRGSVGPAFDGIEDHGGAHPYAYTEDHSRVGYVGVCYPKATHKIMSVAGGLINRFGISGSGALLKMFLGWPVALLCNPYFGPLYIAAERSRRYFPAVNEVAWAKGYTFIYDHFFTPAGELVVTAQDDGAYRLAIDEEEGPPYDEIRHPRWTSGEDRVTYLGRRGLDWFRVVAH
jgi:hypothetical protein